ncbi:MAG TPA: hypothetical protein VFL57_00045 [Bryobacteraceae bacterium]|nr:hypothetical protein [Bryobacteraceae bacterium]
MRCFDRATRERACRRDEVRSCFNEEDEPFARLRHLSEEPGGGTRCWIRIDRLDKRGTCSAVGRESALQPATGLRQPSEHGALLLVEEEFSVLGRAEVVIGELLKEWKLLAALSATHRAKSLMSIIGAKSPRWYEC